MQSIQVMASCPKILNSPRRWTPKIYWSCCAPRQVKGIGPISDDKPAAVAAGDEFLMCPPSRTGSSAPVPASQFCSTTAASALQLTNTSSLQSMVASAVRRSFCANTVTNFPLVVRIW